MCWNMSFWSKCLLIIIALADGALSNQGCSPLNGVPNSDEQQVSISGQRCLNWLDTASKQNSTISLDIESGGWNHSYCRNPDDSEVPWCYVLAQEGSVQKQHCASNICKDSLQSPEKPEEGISKRVRAGPKKKDLGVLGYVLGTLMMAIILLLGSGILIGYFYKRGQSLMREQEQQVCEREMQRINLPLSAFSNPACDLLDETPVPATVLETLEDRRREEEEEEEEVKKDQRPGDQTPDPPGT